MSEALVLDGVDAFYGDSHVLHDVSLSLGEGRLLGLLGRNGAGKSTTMGVTVGLLTPRAGHIAVYGRRVTGDTPERIAAQGVALVPQGRRVFPTLSVEENLMVAERSVDRRGWNMERVYTLFPRIKERRSQISGYLSGGEQQMVVVERALMGRPRVLMLD